MLVLKVNKICRSYTFGKLLNIGQGKKTQALSWEHVYKGKMRATELRQYLGLNKSKMRGVVLN